MTAAPLAAPAVSRPPRHRPIAPAPAAPAPVPVAVPAPVPRPDAMPPPGLPPPPPMADLAAELELRRDGARRMRLLLSLPLESLTTDEMAQVTSYYTALAAKNRALF